MHIQTLHEQGFGAKAIRANYPDKTWSLSTLQTISRRVDETGSAVTRRACRSKSTSTLKKSQRLASWSVYKTFSPDSQTVQHQRNLGPSNRQTRCQVVKLFVNIECGTTW